MFGGYALGITVILMGVALGAALLKGAIAQWYRKLLPYVYRLSAVMLIVAGAYLARAGKKVVVLERRPIVGGAAVTEEIFPGYRFTEFSYVVSLLRPEIIRDLEMPSSKSALRARSKGLSPAVRAATARLEAIP